LGKGHLHIPKGKLAKKLYTSFNKNKPFRGGRKKGKKNNVIKKGGMPCPT